jgi:carboxymethylenebutenolidase
MKVAVVCSVVLLLVSTAIAQVSIKDRLENSPRHQEWMEIQSGKRTLHTFVVYPQTENKATTVLLVHENKGLTDWVRSVADQLAEQGYIAIAPDLLSGMGPKNGNTDSFEDSDAATQAIYRLSPYDVARDLNSVADAALKIKSANGKLAIAGFCWGGGQAFRFATQRKSLNAAFVFYGTFDYTRESLQAITCPVYGFYGGSDARIAATLPETKELMKDLHKKFEAETYENADHAFMRKGEEADASAANKKARDASWARWLQLLSAL